MGGLPRVMTPPWVMTSTQNNWTAQQTFNALIPDSNSTFNIGSTGAVWAEVWADAIKGDGAIAINPGTFVTNITGAASTTNQTLTVENTSNAAAAAHSIVDIKVGGTTSQGHPQLRLTIPSGQSWYVANRNTTADDFVVGTGTDPTANNWLRMQDSAGGGVITFSPPAQNTTGANLRWQVGFQVDGRTQTVTNQVQSTNLVSHVNVGALTINQSGGAEVVDKATGHAAVNPTAGASVTLTVSSAYRAITGGAAVNVAGFFADAQTAGTTNNFQYLMVNGGTEPAALADHVGLYCIDVSASAVLGIASETAPEAEVDETKFSHKLAMRINGATYYMMLTQT